MAHNGSQPQPAREFRPNCLHTRDANITDARIERRLDVDRIGAEAVASHQAQPRCVRERVQRRAVQLELCSMLVLSG